MFTVTIHFPELDIKQENSIVLVNVITFSWNINVNVKKTCEIYHSIQRSTLSRASFGMKMITYTVDAEGFFDLNLL